MHPSDVVEEWLWTAIAGFEQDPADSDMQRGYLAAIMEGCDLFGVHVPENVRNQCQVHPVLGKPLVTLVDP